MFNIIEKGKLEKSLGNDGNSCLPLAGQIEIVSPTTDTVSHGVIYLGEPGEQ